MHCYSDKKSLKAIEVRSNLRSRAPENDSASIILMLKWEECFILNKMKKSFGERWNDSL